MLTKHILLVGVVCMLLAAAWATAAQPATSPASADIVPVPETAPSSRAVINVPNTDTPVAPSAAVSAPADDFNGDIDEDDDDAEPAFDDDDGLFAPASRPTSTLNFGNNAPASAPPTQPWPRVVDPGFHRRPRIRRRDSPPRDPRFDANRAMSRPPRNDFNRNHISTFFSDSDRFDSRGGRGDGGFPSHFSSRSSRRGPRRDPREAEAEAEMRAMMEFEREMALRGGGRGSRGGPMMSREDEMMMMDPRMHGHSAGGPSFGPAPYGHGVPHSARGFSTFRDGDEFESRRSRHRSRRSRRDDEKPLKERCEAIAEAWEGNDDKKILKYISKYVHASYNNHEMPTGGHWFGLRGLEAMHERGMNTVKDLKAKVRVVSVDRGFQRCVLKANMTGTFIRSGGRFTDVTLYNTLDWSLGKVLRMRLVDGGNYDHMMQTYRTRAENATLALAEAIYKHGPGAEVDKLVSANAIVTVGRRGERLSGAKAVSEAMNKIKDAVARFGIERESLILPHPAVKSKQCEMIHADEHNYAGQCRIYNVKTSTTSFKHLDVMYRFRFDMEGKLDRMNVVETRAFLPGELVDKKKGFDYATAERARPADADAETGADEPVIVPEAAEGADGDSEAELLMFDPSRHEDPHPRMYRGSLGRRVRGPRRDVS